MCVKLSYPLALEAEMTAPEGIALTSHVLAPAGRALIAWCYCIVDSSVNAQQTVRGLSPNMRCRQSLFLIPQRFSLHTVNHGAVSHSYTDYCYVGA